MAQVLHTGRAAAGQPHTQNGGEDERRHRAPGLCGPHSAAGHLGLSRTRARGRWQSALPTVLPPTRRSSRWGGGAGVRVHTAGEGGGPTTLTSHSRLHCMGTGCADGTLTTS